MYLRNDKVGVLDLATGETSEETLGAIAGFDNFDAVRTCEAVAKRHGNDCIVLGTGVLTASFVPACCAGMAFAPSKTSASQRAVPLLGFAGVELKQTGFDFVVIRGVASSPGYVWIRDGAIELVKSDSMRGIDSWMRTDKIRSDQGDSKIQVLSVGPWGDARAPASQMVVDYWGGEDKSGLGAELGARNLAAIAFRGMGELELAEPDKHFEDSYLLMREHIARLGESKGLASYCQAARREDFESLVHRHVACYGCPYPCRSYLKISEEPKELRLVSKEPGYLHYDIPALEKLFEMGMTAREATIILIECARAGAEPVSLTSQLSGEGSKIEAALERPSGAELKTKVNIESGFADSGEAAACLGLGLCPRYWARAGFDKVAVSAYAKSALED
jgi:aldehyde:ferredoxin oxidoreductase